MENQFLNQGHLNYPSLLETPFPQLLEDYLDFNFAKQSSTDFGGVNESYHFDIDNQAENPLTRDKAKAQRYSLTIRAHQELHKNFKI